MRKLSLIFLLIITSCIDEDLNYSVRYDGDVIEAKIWFESKYTSVSSESKDFNSGKPDWSEAKTFTLKDVTTVEVPLRQFRDYSVSFDEGESIISTSKLLIHKKGDDYSAIVMIIVPKSEQVDDLTSKLSNNGFGDTFSSFSGAVNFYPWGSRFLVSSYLVEEGKIVRKSSRNVSESNSRWDCYNITINYYVMVCGGGGCSTYQDYSESHDYCRYTPDQDLESDLPPEYIDLYGSGGSGGSYDNSINATITNEVVNPCIREQVNNAISESMANEVSIMIRDIFSVNDDVNLNIVESSELSSEVDADTFAFGVGGITTVEISFNSNTMPFVSQEYIMATAYHEFLHAILFSNSISPEQQHSDMANNYVNILSAALRSHFPNLSQSDAIRLSWAGLQGTDAWNNLSETERTNIGLTNSAHRSLQSGTPCDQ